jgi:ABC-2 type transport system permease protein
MFFLRLLELEFRNFLIYTVRYPLNFVSGIAVLSIFFIGLFFGASYLAGGVNFFLPGRIEAALISFVAWTLTITCLSSISNNIYQEATQGTLEHVISSKKSFLLIMLVRLIVTLFAIFLLNGAIFLILKWITGIAVEINWTIVFPVLAIGISACGLGLVLGGLTLLYKQTQGFINLLQFAIMPLFFLPLGGLSGFFLYLVAVVPSLSGVELARTILTQAPADMTTSFWFYSAIVSGIMWLSIGAFVFQTCLNVAKRRGLLNEY